MIDGLTAASRAVLSATVHRRSARSDLVQRVDLAELERSVYEGLYGKRSIDATPARPAGERDVR